MATGTAQPGGRLANRAGKRFEARIGDELVSLGFAETLADMFLAGARGAVFCRELAVGPSVYGTRMRCDIALRHPVAHPDGLIIEAKWQSSGGSVDEKFPYLVACIKDAYPLPAIVVLDGDGWTGCRRRGRRRLANMYYEFTLCWTSSTTLPRRH
jgi:hypothetical protein